MANEIRVGDRLTWLPCGHPDFGRYSERIEVVATFLDSRGDLVIRTVALNSRGERVPGIEADNFEPHFRESTRLPPQG